MIAPLEPVPVSLLPSVRAREVEAPKMGGWAGVYWAIAVAVVVLIAIGFGFFRRTNLGPVVTADVAIVTAQPLEPVGAAREAVGDGISPSTKLGQTRIKASVKQETMPEVIMPAEERETYEKYVRGIHEGNANPVQPERPLRPIEIASQAISQLQFRNLELGSLTNQAEE